MKSFADLFAGRDDVCGRYVLPPNVKPTATGKLSGAAATRREVVTEASYKKHTEGKERLGIVPIRPGDNTVLWFALDADLYKTPNLHRDLAKKIKRLMLPLVITKSKSGGAHLWCFFRDPIPAVRARDIAKDYIKKLKLSPKTEIFPKQDTIHVEDDGNWINLPYFGKVAVGLDRDGERELTLKQFLSHANEWTQTLDDLKIKRKETDAVVQGEQEGAPPCIETMIEEGIEEGGRNSALAHIGVFLRKKHPDDWQDKLVEYNDSIVHPPLSSKELSTIAQSMHKGEYQYLCSQQPMCAMCDKETCLTRKYGVGSGDNKNASNVVIIEHLEKIEGDEPTYRVTVGGKQFVVPSAEVLMNFRLFKLCAAKRINKVLPHVPQKAWDGYIGELMEGMDIIDAPSATIMPERILDLFKDWISRSTVRRLDAIAPGQPYYSDTDKAVYFKPNSFLKLCDREFRLTKRTDVWRVMRDFGTIETEINVNGAMIEVWKFPLNDERWIRGESE